MKKISYLLSVGLFSISMIVFGCATTPPTIPEGVGDGSESGYVLKNALLPDGSKRDMHLFKTNVEANAFVKECMEKEFGEGRLFMRYPTGPLDNIKLSRKKGKIEEEDEGLYVMPYTVEELGDIGAVMFEKGLGIAICNEKRGNILRQFSICFYNDWISTRYSKIDFNFMDEATYQAKLAAQKEADRLAQERTDQKLREMRARNQESVTESNSALMERLTGVPNNSDSSNNSNPQIISSSTSYNQTKIVDHRKNREDLEMRLSAIANGQKVNQSRGNPSSALERDSIVVTNSELALYESLLEQGCSPDNAAREVYNRYRK